MFNWVGQTTLDPNKEKKNASKLNFHFSPYHHAQLNNFGPQFMDS